MTDPIVAAKSPEVVELTPGEYWWCSCGRSKTQPFCDHSHEGTGLHPVKFVIAEKQTLALCRCKRTGDQPRCDGTHRSL